jgi:hypothetical protein
MEGLLEAIRIGTSADASPEARQAAANACRTILTALEAKPGEPIAAAAPINTTQIASVIGALRGVPPDQLLDLAIAKLRAALPAGTEAQPVTPLKFHIIPVGARGGG